MIQVNLIPDVKLELIKAQRHRNVVISFSIISMIAAGAVVVLLGLFLAGQMVTERAVTNNIKELDEEFRDTRDIQKTVTVQNQLANIQTSHEQKAMMSRMFDLIVEASAKGTDNSVTLNTFSVDTETNTISLQAQTDKRGFSAAEVFRKNIEGMKMYYVEAEGDKAPFEFKEDHATKAKDEQSVSIANDVVLSDLSYGSDEGQKTVSFRITFAYEPTLFAQNVDMLRIRGLDRGNVTDSYQRVPQSLFSQEGGSNEGADS